MAPQYLGFSKIVVGALDSSVEFYKEVCGPIERFRFDVEFEGRKLREVIFEPPSPGAPFFMLMQYLDTTEWVTGEAVVGFVCDDIEVFVERAALAGGTIAQEPRA